MLYVQWKYTLNIEIKPHTNSQINPFDHTILSFRFPFLDVKLGVFYFTSYSGYVNKKQCKVKRDSTSLYYNKNLGLEIEDP